MLDAGVYERLSRLQLAMNHKSSRNLSGNRKSLHKGISAEFSDFREYMPGDDLRRLDWNVYARLDKMYIREYMEEKEAYVNVLLDTSASMDYGKEKKSNLALELAAVMAYLSLHAMDRLALYDMKDVSHPLVLGGGTNSFGKVLPWLSSRSFSGECDILEAIKRLHHPGAGVTVVISDFLQEAMISKENQTYESMMKYLSFHRQKPVILQTLSGEELRVNMEGTRNLIDMETGKKLRITMDASVLRKYEQTLHGFTGRLETGCRKARGTYVLCDASKDRNHLIFEDLRVLYDI